MYIKLFANCIPVKGYCQSFIFDLQRRFESCSIPNSLYDILTYHKNKSLTSIKQAYDNKYDEIIDEYFEFLVNKEFAFECSKEEIDNFPDIDLSYYTPSDINNAIIDLDGYDETYLEKIFNELSKARCNAIQLRFYSQISIESLISIGRLLDKKRLLSVELVLKYSNEFTVNTLLDLKYKFPRYHRFFIYDSPSKSMTDEIYFFLEKMNFLNDCGKVSSSLFSISIDTISESLNWNSCLNRKVSIDINGNIKNCPYMPDSYGNIRSTSLSGVIRLPRFKEYWSIKKDDIETCRDCEYRYICTDCRAFTNNLNNKYSQPSKCTYNPYIALWKEESGWLSVEQWRSENPDWKENT
jgi:SPASM domain peptide maturase of grasp-with-spasm system